MLKGWATAAVFVLLASGCAAGRNATCGPSPTLRPAVPYRAQAAIKRYVPSAAYVPTRLPPGTYGYGFYFGKWGVGVGGDLRRPKPNSHGSGFGIAFNQKGNAVPGLLTYWLSRGAPCRSEGSPMATFRFGNGASVYWSGTYEDQQAWRCVQEGGARFVVLATRSVAGDDTAAAGRARRDAVELACVLAYIRPAR